MARKNTAAAQTQTNATQATRYPRELKASELLQDLKDQASTAKANADAQRKALMERLAGGWSARHTIGDAAEYLVHVEQQAAIYAGVVNNLTNYEVPGGFAARAQFILDSIEHDFEFTLRSGVRQPRCSVRDALEIAATNGENQARMKSRDILRRAVNTARYTLVDDVTGEILTPLAELGPEPEGCLPG